MSDPITRLNVALSGRYAIERKLGEGGMATVYLADDLKHGRKVALKVLKPELAAVLGSERFLAEIRTTANLQHPHILPLHDSGSADGLLYYVMPRVEGESLRERIDRERQLPIDEAVRITTNVAEALDCAHRHGVIHRDIKPANILLLDGKPVISDFGIALAVSSGGAGRLTETGLSLGTPHYMSPEQATGDQTVGPATDIYALGCVLYEMLVGEPPYTGSTPQAILGKIIQAEPVSATKARRTVPANVDAAIRKALEKVPADRFSGAGEFARALADSAFRGDTVDASGIPTVRGKWSAVTVALCLVAMTSSVGLGMTLLRPAPESQVLRVPVALPESQRLAGEGRFELAPDGSFFVYQGPSVTDEDGSQLWVRRWDGLDATPIEDTEGGVYFAISPDGNEVAVARQGNIRIVPIFGLGGVARTVGDGSVRNTPAWSPDGAWLYFNNLDLGLSRVPASDGPVEVLTRVDTNPWYHIYVHVLPGGEWALFESSPGNFQGANPLVMAVRPETGEVREIVAGQYPRYAQGHLLFVNAEGGTLMAAPFDVDAMQITAPPTPILDGLRSLGGGTHFYSVSVTGQLVYSRGTAVLGNAAGFTQPAWVMRGGIAMPVDSAWRILAGARASPKLSPSGDRLAISIFEPDGTSGLWVKRLNSGPAVPITSDGGFNAGATWSADGGSLTYVSDRSGRGAPWTVRADGSGSAHLAYDAGAHIDQALLTPDGAWLVYFQAGDLFGVRRGESADPVPLVVDTEADASSPAFSPDGQWLAYVSNESGRNEVYVRPFPDVNSGRPFVSTNGGLEPVWATSGRELFYRNGQNDLVAVQVRAESSTWDEEVTLFSTAGYMSSVLFPMYDVSRDDQRFLMLPVESIEYDLVLVQNVFEELRARVGS